MPCTRRSTPREIRQGKREVQPFQAAELAKRNRIVSTAGLPDGVLVTRPRSPYSILPAADSAQRRVDPTSPLRAQLIDLIPGPNSGYSSQSAVDDRPTTDIQWTKEEFKKLLLLVGDCLYLGRVGAISLHFPNKVNETSIPSCLALSDVQTRYQIQKGHEVLKMKGLLPVHPPLSAIDLSLCTAALKESFKPKAMPGDRAVIQPLAFAEDDGLSDADAAGEMDNEIDPNLRVAM
ncbi:hypothetical protein B0H13DRAFT_2310173 [Mycena leptocephala]|nr:hypothetical protein B0H13DRAFT_2310173 [Mycena leptocephala]